MAEVLAPPVDLGALDAHGVEEEKTAIETKTDDVVPLPWAETMFGAELATAKGGPTKSTSEVLAGKEFVAVFFSEATSGGCIGFAQKLLSFYGVAQDKGEAFEVLYVSCDAEESTFNEFRPEMCVPPPLSTPLSSHPHPFLPTFL